MNTRFTTRGARRKVWEKSIEELSELESKFKAIKEPTLAEIERNARLSRQCSNTSMTKAKNWPGSTTRY